jgi:hypothetical protein
MSHIKDGHYAYRFKGFAQDSKSIEYYLVGVGTLSLGDGQVTGRHRASFLRLSRGVRPPTDGNFTVAGKVDWDPREQCGSAELIFTEQAPPSPTRQVLKGRFALVQAGPNEYWLTSYGGADVVYGSQPAIKGTELVEGELRWISSASTKS